MEGQFFPGQLAQFEDGQPRNLWRGYTLIDAITRLGLTSSLQVCLDAGDSASYTSGQSWLDRSGNGHDFFLGTTSGAQASDPTFNGTPGGVSSSEYWSFDGGDFFQYDTTNAAWMQELHKDNAQFTICTWIWMGTIPAIARVTGTRGGSTDVGFVFGDGGNGQLQLVISNGSANIFSQTSGSANVSFIQGGWCFAAISFDEVLGTNGARYFANGSTALKDATFTGTPSTGNAARTMQIGATNSAGIITANSRMAAFAAWQGVALTLDQLQSIFVSTRSRFGV